MTPLSALPIAAAALSLPLAWRTPAYRPFAVALVAAQALEALRPALPPELAWGALLALPPLSTWAVAWTLGVLGDEPIAYGVPAVIWWAGFALASIFLPGPWWWSLSLACAVAFQFWAWWTWRAARPVTEEPPRPILRQTRDGSVYRRGVEVVGYEPARVAPPSASEQAALVLAAGDAGGLLVGLAAGWAAVGWWAAAVAAVLVGVQARAIWRAWR